MQSTTYVEAISFVSMYPLLCVVLAHEPLVVWLVGIMLLGMFQLLLVSATISHTFCMTNPTIFSLGLVMSIVLKVRHGLVIHDAFVYGVELSILRLCLCPIIQPVHEVDNIS